MKKLVIKLLGYVLDYAPVIITVILATIASLTAIKNEASLEELLQWILTILALIATTQLIDRFRVLRNLNDNVEKIVSEKHEGRANDFFIHLLPELQERLRLAKSIAISGVTLARTSVSYWPIFQERLAQRTSIRVLIVDPDNSSAIEMAAYRTQRHQDPNHVKTEIEHALGNFSTLHQRKSARSKPIQVRLMPFVPSYGIWLIDSGSENAEIWVETYTFRGTTEPVFHLIPRRDGEWFSFFERQFEQMWSISRTWELERSIE